MPPETTPAASLILMRDKPGSTPDILIARRSKTLRFAGGAYVFPGGAVDPADILHAATHCPDLDPEDAAARIAGARETLEETAIAVGLSPALRTGQDFAASLDGRRHRFEADTFTPFARWRPEPGGASRRFDTRFYLAAAPRNDEPRADGAETSAVFWANATEILARSDDGDGFVLFPTRRLLERLALFDSFAEAVSHARSLPDRIITPWIDRRDDGDWLCIPNDAGYPVDRQRLKDAIRG